MLIKLYFANRRQKKSKDGAPRRTCPR